MLCGPTNSVLRVFSIILLSCIASFLEADDLFTSINADKVTITEDGILIAEGKVEIKQGSSVIKAASLEFNEATNKIKLSGIDQFVDEKGSVISADKADLDANLREGIIYAAKIIMSDNMKIRAQDVRILDGEIQSAKGLTRVTSCDECEDENPLWHFTAASTERDVSNQNLIFKRVSIKIKGVPVGYIPYLRLPDPSIRRAQGFLAPSLPITSNLGIGIKLPYFIPLGDSNDLLLTPYISNSTKTIEYRYRKALVKGDLTFNGAISKDELVLDKIRAFGRVSGTLELAYGTDFIFDIGSTSDKFYLRDYAYNNKSDFDAKVSIDKSITSKQQSFEGKLSYVHDIENRQTNREYVLLEGTFSKFLQNYVPGKLIFDTGVRTAAILMTKTKFLDHQVVWRLN